MGTDYIEADEQLVGMNGSAAGNVGTGRLDKLCVRHQKPRRIPSAVRTSRACFSMKWRRGST